MIRLRHLLFAILLAALLIPLTFSSSRPALAAAATPDSGYFQRYSLHSPGEIGFLTAPSSGQPLAIVADLLQNRAADLALSAEDINSSGYVVADSYSSQHNGVNHIYLQQMYQGIRVYNAYINANVMANGQVLNLTSAFVPDIANAINTTSPRLTATEVVNVAAEYLDLTISTPLSILEEAGTADQAVIFSDGGISLESIPVTLVYQPLSTGEVRLAWNIDIYELGAQNYWSMRFDAQTGAILNQNNFVVHDEWGETTPAGERVAIAHIENSQAATTPAIQVPAGANESYRVFPLGVESPIHGAMTLEEDPFDITASPFGWHDTDGAAGPEFTTTQGNNVHADTDLDANNIPDGNSPDGTASLTFDFPFDDNNDPSTYRDFAITNLFYWNNIMHDVSYHFGFDEPAGNFQENNYGNGGAASDYVHADAQDGSSTNNANFGTPSDGFNPRMQMFIWTYPFANLVTVNSPPSIAGDYIGNPSVNGGSPTGLTGDLELVIDTTAPTDDGCDTVTNNLAGNIAVIVWNQGACNSSTFVANAANAGAIGVIIIDNTDEPRTNFGGSAAVPSLSIGQADGQAIIAELGSTVNVSVVTNPAALADRDSDIDNGIIAHEYGHGISNRLTGGPAASGCLGNGEQMGEGWSDWQALYHVTTSANTAAESRGIGNYPEFQPITAAGIRPFPYSTDLGTNPVTYGMIDDGGAITIPHGLGSIWNAMLWEVYWGLVDEYGFNPDYYADWTTGGNNLAHQLVMDGMKLQPCSPGFVDGRDAILAADLALTGGVNECTIWEGFAKRGLGAGADQGSSGVVGDETEAFNVPVHCDPNAQFIYLPVINRP